LRQPKVAVFEKLQRARQIRVQRPNVLAHASALARFVLEFDDADDVVRIIADDDIRLASGSDAVYRIHERLG
jgi:selenocysteine lyase/cysteine desulfurase